MHGSTILLVSLIIGCFLFVLLSISVVVGLQIHFPWDVSVWKRNECFSKANECLVWEWGICHLEVKRKEMM
jgi:hypothetical protein